MHIFWGQHTLCNMAGINGINLNDSEDLIKKLKRSIETTNATLVEIVCHKFEPEGLSIVAILQESHAALHIYPEHRALFMDVFTCGKAAEPEEIVNTFIKQLKPERYTLQTCERSFPY